MCALLFDLSNRCSLVKKNIGKGMPCIYYWEKPSQNCRKVNFLDKKFEEMH